MPTFEDEQPAREAIKGNVEGDEHVRFDIERVAELEWDEDRSVASTEPTRAAD